MTYKKINWWSLSALVGSALLSKREIEDDLKETPNKNTMTQDQDTSLAEKWRLNYKLSSTNYIHEPTIIFKFGGSAWRQEDWQANIIDRIKQLKELHPRYSMILTTGGGKVQELSKDMYDALGISEETYRESAGRALATQAQTLADLLGGEGIYVEPDALHYISASMLKDKIPVVSMVGKDYIDFVEIQDNGGVKRIVNGIPEDQSDAHTMVFAHYLGQQGAVFAKFTDGVWIVDPNVRPEHGEVYNTLQARLIALGHSENMKIPKLKATDVLEGKIARLGKDMREQHLAESLGLRLYLNPESTVRWLQVININNQNDVRNAFEGYAKGKHYSGSVITKD
ncbi:hypothetical protein HYS31_04270 [Candidatus Woesearchaeota archaeon]|nr:hypothetical protein [Candidatus Woesearchaeota archaeon]